MKWLRLESDRVYEEAKQTVNHSKLVKSFDIQEKAKYYRRKAAAVGRSGISSDDPEAIEKLKNKLSLFEKNQERMRRANALIRKNDREGLKKLDLNDEQIEQLFKPDFAERIGFPDYALRNNNAAIHRLMQRILALEANRAREEVTEEKDGYTYREDKEENRILFEFDGKPDETTRALLKSHGFRWSPTRSAWVRQLNNSGRWTAKAVMLELQAKASN